MSEPMNVARKIISEHLVDGEMTPGTPIGLKIDQTLTQDATGTMVMLELEAMQLDRVRTEVSVQYVDHNLIQQDHKNPDDHLFLQSACERFGIHYSRAGNGISHAVHMEHFGKPGTTLAGSDSHSPAAGALGMVAIGSGGLDVALAAAGEPLRIKMPEVWGVELTGELPPWTSAKDIILEMLRRHDVDGGVGRIIEYYGPGLDGLSAMDRHVIANMGAELGATTTVFPADEEVRRFLTSMGREGDFTEIVADEGASYDHHESIDLSAIVPLIAEPVSPGNVRPVSEVAGKPISQAYVGSSANPGYRDFAICAEIVRAAGERANTAVSFDINPSSRQVLANLINDGHLLSLVTAGARIHQAGCNGCIGMGQAPATDTISLRTTPRNFPGRSGTMEDMVHLCSPETATASALTGVITDQRDLADKYGISFPQVTDPETPIIDKENLLAPVPKEEALQVKLRKGPNIASIPDFDGVPDAMDLEVMLVVGDDVSTDEISPAGSRVLPFRSNIPKISEFTYDIVDETYHVRAAEARDDGRGHAIVGGTNYGQGSSREHAALAPRYLGLRAVLAKDYARIHWQNLVNFGVLPLEFTSDEDKDAINSGDVLELRDLHATLAGGGDVAVRNATQGTEFRMSHRLSERQVDVLLAGGVINVMKERLGGSGEPVATDQVAPGREDGPGDR